MVLRFGTFLDWHLLIKKVLSLHQKTPLRLVYLVASQTWTHILRFTTLQKELCLQAKVYIGVPSTKVFISLTLVMSSCVLLWIHVDVCVLCLNHLCVVNYKNIIIYNLSIAINVVSYSLNVQCAIELTINEILDWAKLF